VKLELRVVIIISKTGVEKKKMNDKNVPASVGVLALIQGGWVLLSSGKAGWG